MTKKLGLILVTLAFLYGSFVLVRKVPEDGAPVRWGPWSVAMLVGALGIALARSGARSAMIEESTVARNLDVLNASLSRITSGLTDTVDGSRAPVAQLDRASAF